MDVERYYLRHKIDQELYVYLEIGETWEESFMMEFRMTEGFPHFIITGALFEHRYLLIAFKWMAITDIVELSKDKKNEWRPVNPDEALLYCIETLKESFVKK